MPASHTRPVAAYSIHPVITAVTALLALVLQAFLPIKFALAHLMDFPLLITIYFALLRRDKIFGIGLGTALGLLQDTLSHGYIGIFGIAKAIVGYMVAYASTKLELETLVARTLLTAICVLIHSLCLETLQHTLLETPPPSQPLTVASAILVNAALGLILFQILDRFRHVD